jgi:membrane fusion protein (multidrug efflux system)
MSEKSFVRRHSGLLLLVVIVVALAIPKLMSLGDAAPEAAPAQQTEKVLRVTAHRVVPKRMEERLSTTGTVRANEQVAIVSEIAGKVERILFDEGSRVSQGQLLVEINAAELQAERERAAYRVSLAEKLEDRQRTLRDEGILSPQEYDIDLNQLNVYRSELALIDARLTKTEIRAPFAGTIGLRRVSEGSYLSPQTTIATLQDLDPIKVDFSVPERYAGEVRVGGEIEFRVKGGEQPRRARIYAIEPAVDAETRSLLLRAISPNSDRALLPGSFADVDLRVRAVDNALAVPSIAVIPELGGKKVFVYENGTAQPRAVETGLRTESEVEVTRGLAAGDLVLTSGILELRAGSAVELAEPPPAAGAAVASPEAASPEAAEAGVAP